MSSFRKLLKILIFEQSFPDIVFLTILCCIFYDILVKIEIIVFAILATLIPPKVGLGKSERRALSHFAPGHHCGKLVSEWVSSFMFYSLHFGDK